MKVWICLNGSEVKSPPTPEQVWRSVFCLSVIEHIQPDGQIVLHGTQATFDFDVIGVHLGLTPGQCRCLSIWSAYVSHRILLRDAELHQEGLSEAPFCCCMDVDLLSPKPTPGWSRPDTGAPADPALLASPGLNFHGKGALP